MKAYHTVQVVQYDAADNWREGNMFYRKKVPFVLYGDFSVREFHNVVQPLLFAQFELSFMQPTQSTESNYGQLILLEVLNQC